MIISSFPVGRNPTATWLSKVFRFETAQLFTAVRVEVEGACTVEFIADGATVATLEFTNTNKIHRLPPVRATLWQFKITTSGEVRRLVVGSSMEEVRP